MAKRKVLIDVDFDFFLREPPILDWSHAETKMFQEVVWQSRVITPLDLGEILTPPNDVKPLDFFQALKDRGFDIYNPLGFAADSHATVGGMIPSLMELNDNFDPEGWGLDDDSLPENKWTIYHFDAHHDLGYNPEKDEACVRNGRVYCDNWLRVIPHFCSKIDKIVVVYPEWRREPCPITDDDHLMKELDTWRSVHDEEYVRDLEENFHVPVEFVYWNDLQAPEAPVEVITICQSSAWVPPWYDEQFAEFLDSAPVSEMEKDFDGEDGEFQPRPGWAQSWDEVVAEPGIAHIRSQYSDMMGENPCTTK